jgi:glycosyltransferase involved in cell wall biosynthesis
VVIEALAAGLPVVTTDCSVSMRALVGRFGTVVPLGDAAALAAAMLAQPALDADARAEAAEAMRAFTVERAAGAYAGLFRAVHEAAATRLPASGL